MFERHPGLGSAKRSTDGRQYRTGYARQAGSSSLTDLQRRRRYTIVLDVLHRVAGKINRMRGPPFAAFLQKTPARDVSTHNEIDIAIFDERGMGGGVGEST